MVPAEHVPVPSARPFEHFVPATSSASRRECHLCGNTVAYLGFSYCSDDLGLTGVDVNPVDEGDRTPVVGILGSYAVCNDCGLGSHLPASDDDRDDPSVAPEFFVDVSSVAWLAARRDVMIGRASGR